MLRCHVEKNEDWEKYLHLVLLSYRTSKHTSTGISPFQLMYGRDPQVITQFLTPAESNQTSHEQFLRRKLIKIREFVEGNLIKAQHRQKEYYDAHTSWRNSLRFTVGDSVWLSLPHSGVSKKLSRQMGGRMVVTQIKGPVDVLIKNTDGRVKVVNVNRLQPHVRREGNGIQNLNQSLIRTDRNKTTEINNPLKHTLLVKTNNLTIY